jgi:hypothetical protein
LIAVDHVCAVAYSPMFEQVLTSCPQPVGVGFSHGSKESLRRTSEEAAWDLDDFLQALWA